MRDFFDEVFSNRILIAGALGWLTAQVLKTIIFAITNHGLNWSRLVGDGGMPSGQAARRILCQNPETGRTKRTTQ